MTLQEVKTDLSECLAYKYEAKSAQNNSQDIWFIKPWVKIHEQLDRLSKYNFAKPICDTIFNLSPSFELREEQAIVSATICNDFQNQHNKLIMLTKSAISILSQFIVEDKENIIKIKLPKIANFKELDKTVHDLNYIFYNSRLLTTDETVSVSGVETGSIIINIFFNDPASINNFADFIKSCIEIAALILQTKLVIKQLRQCSASPEVVKEAQKSLDQSVDAKCNEQASKLGKAIDSANDNWVSKKDSENTVEKNTAEKDDKVDEKGEEKSSLNMALKRGAVLISKGMTVTTSKATSNDVMEKFPKPVEYPKFKVENRIDFLMEENLRVGGDDDKEQSKSN